MDKNTIAVIGVLIVALGLFYGISRDVRNDIREEISEIRTDVNSQQDIVMELLRNQGEIAGFLDAIDMSLVPPENPPEEPEDSSSESGNDVTETLDYLADTPRRIGREVERTLENLNPF